MKKTVLFIILVVAMFVVIGCSNNSPSTSSINGIAFEPDLYSISSVSSASTVKSISGINPVAGEANSNNIEEVLQAVLPNGTLTTTTHGFIYKPATGSDWTITEAQWDEIEDRFDDIEVTIDGQLYEAEFDLQDTTGTIEVELDPFIAYPASFTTIKLVDEKTGIEVTGDALAAFQDSGIEEYFTTLYTGKTWSDGSLIIDAVTFQTEDDFEIYEEDFEDEFEEFIYNGKEYEFELGEPFKNTLYIEVEADDDDDSQDDDD